MVYRETKAGVTRLTGGAVGGGGGGTPGKDGLTPTLRGVSTTPLAIATGNKTFVFNPEMNVPFAIGTVVRASGISTSTYMTGVVTAATTASVTLSVMESAGTGTFANWVLTVAGFKGVQGTRWGQVGVWVYEPMSNVPVVFNDGLPPRIGDFVVSGNGFDVGAVSKVTFVVDATHADLAPANLSLRGPAGPPGDNALVGWPVGSVFIGYGPTSPAVLLGGGTWTQVGKGQVLVGQDDSDTDYQVEGSTGGAKRRDLPPHSHYDTLVFNKDAEAKPVGTGGGQVLRSSSSLTGTVNDVRTPSLVDQIDVRQNYLVVRFWRRTA